MIPTKTIRRHADLLDRMAGAQGIDLEEQMMRGRLTIPQLDDAVLRCTGCTDPDRCHALLCAPGETELPSFCRNADLFDVLTRD